MAELNARDRELTVRIVYYGPAVGGKTTNLRLLHRQAQPARRGEMISLNSLQDRTILFDLLPLRIGEGSGTQLKLQLVAVPGQAAYDATRKVLLRGADGVVFVANSAADRFYDNCASMKEMRRHLVEQGIDPDRSPLVLQYNKRDLPEVSEAGRLDRALNQRGQPALLAVAITGDGVLETFAAILERTVAEVARRFPEAKLTRGLAPGDWARQAVDACFGRQSLPSGAGDEPALASERTIRVPTAELEHSEPISIAEAYADTCGRLGIELSDARSEVVKARHRLADLRRATELAVALEPGDPDAAARALLSSLGEAAGAAHATYGSIEGQGFRAVPLPPLERDPVLADPGGLVWALRQASNERATVCLAAEDPTLEAALAWAGPAVAGVVLVPLRSGRGVLGLALLYLLEGDPLLDPEELAHMDALAAVFALSIERTALAATPRSARLRTGPVSAVRMEDLPASTRSTRAGRPVFHPVPPAQ